jgi:hypothetical protein
MRHSLRSSRTVWLPVTGTSPREEHPADVDPTRRGGSRADPTTTASGDDRPPAPVSWPIHDTWRSGSVIIHERLTPAGDGAGSAGHRPAYVSVPVQPCRS